MKTILKLTVALIIALGVGLAWRAQARWSTTVSIKNNVVRTGSVSLAVEPNDAWLAIDGLAPGQSISRQVALTNTGTTGLRLWLTAKKAAGYSTVFNALVLDLTELNGNSLFHGSLSDANQTLLGDLLAAGARRDIMISIALPEDASSDAANSYANITFDLTAEQV